MKIERLTCIAALFAALALPIQLAAQIQARYTVIDLGTLGGTFGSGEGISNRAWVDGFSTLPGDTITHAFLFQNGMMMDIGTPGLNSLVAYPFNEDGEVAIHAEVSTPDPFGEDFCGFNTHLGCPPFVWRAGVLTRLPTLGGNNGHANQVNNRGEVAGVAENTASDPTCVPQECVENICPFQVLQTDPVVWKRGHIRKLSTLPGDLDGEALVINDNGQVAGTSGQCIGSANEALHAVLWQNGTVIDLGNLGGTTNNHPQYINNRGQVVGYSNLSGDETNHAFLWQEGVMIDLGTLRGDLLSFGEAGNDLGEVGGFSCDINFNCRAFLWQNGVMKDVNTLIFAGAPLFLVDVLSINSRGEIAGDAVQISTGEGHAYLATPVRGEGPSEGVTSAAPVEALRPKVVLPEKIRKMLEKRLGRRYQIPGLRTTSALSMSGTMISTPPVNDIAPDSLQEPALSRTTTPTLACLGKGAQCRPGYRCCPGLVCVPASTRAFCE